MGFWVLCGMVGFVAAVALLSIVAAIRQNPTEPPTQLTHWSAAGLVLARISHPAAIVAAVLLDRSAWTDYPVLLAGAIAVPMAFFTVRDLILALIDQKVRYYGVTYTRADAPGSFWFFIVTGVGLLIMIPVVMLTFARILEGN